MMVCTRIPTIIRFLIYLHCSLVVSFATLGAANVKDRACDSCASSLLDLLGEISQDLAYANKSIETGISTTLNSKLIDLNNTLEEHSIGLRDSQELLDRSKRTLEVHLGDWRTSDNFDKLLEKLELDILDQLEAFKTMMLDLSKVGLNINKLQGMAPSDESASPPMGTTSSTSSLLCRPQPVDPNQREFQ